MTFRTKAILTVLYAILIGACDSGSVTQQGNTDGLAFKDGGADAEYCPSGIVCGPNKTCCGSDQICAFDTCMEDQGPCSADEHCMDDTYCHEGKCIPWGSGPKGDVNEECTYLVPIGLFSPAQQCAWTGPPAGDPHPNHKNVLGTPTVADFNFDDNTAVKKPSIIFVSYDGEDGSAEADRCNGGFFGVIRVIDGASCEQQHTVDMAQVRASSPLAIGDVDLDGRPDIVAARCGGGLVAFTYDGTAKAFKLLWTSNPSDTGATDSLWSGPSIHDLDNNGTPEILLGGTVFSNTGVLIDGTLGLLPYNNGSIPVAADLDGDGTVELVNGAGVWAWSGGTWTVKSAPSANAAGHVAVADFGTYGSDPAQDDRGKLDGVAEIAVVSSGTVRAQTLAGRVLFGPVSIPAGGIGGPPTIGDFDKDGRVEVAAAGQDSYSVFDPDCTGSPQQATCDSLSTTGILWTRVSQDHSSSVTGSSIFDFEGDGAAEAIYADECFTRVYEGKTGEVLYSQWRTSCTWYENPIVADVDGDFNSELVVPSNSNCEIDTNCNSNPNHHQHPQSGLTLDPMFKGLRCETDNDCPGGGCDSGLCRCTSDAQCGGGGFVCSPAVAGTPGTGQVCRSAFKGDISGLLVFRDMLDRWVNSRIIWNQHAYAITNIYEDGTVPPTSAWKLNWKETGLNNFRQNTQGSLDPTSTPDLTAKKQTNLTCDAEGNLMLRVKLCNRGTQPVAPGVSVTFYLGQPSSGEAICTATSQTQIDPGTCEDVSCAWHGAPAGSDNDVYVVADDDGSGKGGTTECEEGNNLTVLKGVSCTPVE